MADSLFARRGELRRLIERLEVSEASDLLEVARDDVKFAVERGGARLVQRFSFEKFDRFMLEAPADLPMSLGGDCPCGGEGDAHVQRCPLRSAAGA